MLLCRTVKQWETVGEKLRQAGWTWSYVRFVRNGQYIDRIDAHRGDGKRYIIWSDDRLRAFAELEHLLTGPNELKL
jgi:hypothetical protein